jgi:hypothetical protein
MRIQRWLSVAFAAVALLVSNVREVAAQGLTTGAVGGLVTDNLDRPAEGVQVQIRNQATGFSAGGLTRSNGRYLVQGLAVGTYTVTIRRIGFEPVTRPDIQVTLGQTTVVDVALKEATTQIAGVTITGAGTGADFSPSKQGAGTVLNDTVIRRLPTLNRNFTDLTKATPQVSQPQAGGGPSAGGVYNRFNNYTVDGVNQNDRFSLGSSGGTPGGATNGRIMSIEAVKEFQVLLSPTDVRYGNFAGMLVNAVTKSGTNQWQGGATYTFRTPQMAYDTLFIRGADFDVKQFGFSLGGPIIKDKLHFFIAPEFQQRTDPTAGPSVDVAGNRIGDVSLDSIARISQIMSARGLDVGTTASIRRENPLSNLFGRLDWQINGANRLAFRQLYNTAEQDEFSRNVNNFNTNVGQQNSGIRLTSNSFSRRNTNISSVATLYTTGQSGWSNELSIGYNTIEDERIVPVNTPEIAVAVTPIGGTAPSRPVTFGTERFSPGNLLEQRILEVSNNFTKSFGDHTLTFGGRYENTYIYNYFLSGAANGAYIFPSIARLQAGTPSGYAFSYANGGDIQAEFSGQQLTAYAQDLWNVSRNFAVTYGVRVDLPSYLDSPVLNQDILTRSTAAGLPVRTDWTPESAPLFSPRIGFNWNVNGDFTTQVRGNIGIFTAPVPYIMSGNAYSNTGLGGVTVSCTEAAGNVPLFTTDLSQLPTSCAGTAPPVPGAAGTVGINVNDPNFKNPQNLTASFGFDRKLPAGFVFTFEGLYRKAINGMYLEDLNFRGPREVGGQPYTTNTGRVIYADTITTNATGAVSVNNNSRRLITATGTNNLNFAEGIVYLTNQSADYNYTLSGQLRRRFDRSLEIAGAYTFMQSKDVQSLTSDRAISNYRNGNQTGGIINDKTNVGTSYFERPHRVLVFGTYTAPWTNAQTDITFSWEGMSGTPFTYTVNSDVNGDGIISNDPIYIPRNGADPSEIRIGTGLGTAFAPNAAAAADFESFIAKQDCLNSQRGQIMERNSCRSPWQNRMDVSIRQSLPRVRGQSATLQLDIFNAANFVNRSWGRILLPVASPDFPQQNILTVRNRQAAPLSSETANGYEFDNRLRTGPAFTPAPNRTSDFYQLQLTLRLAF